MCGKNKHFPTGDTTTPSPLLWLHNVQRFSLSKIVIDLKENLNVKVTRPFKTEFNFSCFGNSFVSWLQHTARVSLFQSCRLSEDYFANFFFSFICTFCIRSVGYAEKNSQNRRKIFCYVCLKASIFRPVRASRRALWFHSIPWAGPVYQVGQPGRWKSRISNMNGWKLKQKLRHQNLIRKI